MSVIERDSRDIWKLIAYETGMESSLLLVSKSARSGLLGYIKEYILPLLATVYLPQRAIDLEVEKDVIKEFYRLREGKISYPNGNWVRPIHIVINKILTNILNNGYESDLMRFSSLLKARVDVNASSSQRQIPLLSVCDKLGSLFSTPPFSIRPSDEQKRIAYSRIVELLSLLLDAGANPNVQAYPSTPLVTILVQQAFGNEDIELDSTMIAMLLKRGADPDLIPLNDTYGLGQSPRSLAVGKMAALFNRSLK